jgi:hypothetical protein
MTLSALTKGSDYSFKVQALNAAGSSDLSNVESITFAFVPDAPLSPQISTDGTNTLVKWSAPLNGGKEVVGYLVSFSSGSDVFVVDT